MSQKEVNIALAAGRSLGVKFSKAKYNHPNPTVPEKFQKPLPKQKNKNYSSAFSKKLTSNKRGRPSGKKRVSISI